MVPKVRDLEPDGADPGAGAAGRLGGRLAALALFALAVRIATASACGPMNDEAFTAFLSARPWSEILTAARPDNNPPGYYLVLHPLAVLTRDVLFLRLPSILAGIGAVVLTGLAGRRLKVGWGPALVMACAYPLWLTDGQIRQYGPILLAATGALVLSLQACRRPLGGRGLSLYVGCCAVLPVLSYGGFLTVGALGLAALAGPAPRRRLAWVSLLSLAPGVGWLAYAVTGPTHSDLLRSVFSKPGPLQAFQVPSYLTGLALPLYWSPEGPVPYAGLVEAALGLALAAVAILGFRRLRVGGATPEAWTLGAAFLIPMLSLFAMGLSGAQPFQPRYLVPYAPPFLLLLFAGTGVATGRTLAGLAVALNLGTALLFTTAPHLWNQDWPDVARWIQARQEPGDRLAVWRAYSLVGLNFSYAPGDVTMDFRTPGQLRFDYGPGYSGLPQTALGAGLPDQGLDGRRLFLVLSPSDDPAANAVIGGLNRDWEVADARVQTSVNSWGRIAVYLLTPRAPQR